MSKGANRFSRFFRAPIRALCRARDLYVRAMTGCARSVQPGHGAAFTYPTIGGVSRSFSYHSSSRDDDIRELIRAASQTREREMVLRSQSAVVGRINEDEPCEFGNGDVGVGESLLFPRSRSCVVPVRSSVSGRTVRVIS